MDEEQKEAAKKFGKLVKKLRIIDKEYSLRDFAKLTDTPGNISAICKVEKGERHPPKKIRILRKWASVLGVANDDKQWKEFYELACIANRIIPEHLPANIIQIHRDHWKGFYGPDLEGKGKAMFKVGVNS